MTIEQTAQQVYVEAERLLDFIRQCGMSGQVAETALIVAAGEIAGLRSSYDGNLEPRVADLQAALAICAKARCSEHKRERAMN